MAQNYDTLDARWTWNGDFAIDAGVLKDTKADYLLSLYQEVHTVCASSLRDWENYPNLGATINDFIGEANTASTASAISDRLEVSLVAANVVAEEDLAIRVIPVHINKVLVVIGINAIATEYNQLTAGEKLIISFVFDSLEQDFFFLDQTPELIPR